MSNKEALRRAETIQTLMMIIRKRELEFLGHIMRKHGLEELILTGSVDGKRGMGRQRKIPYKPKKMGGRTDPKERER